MSLKQAKSCIWEKECEKAKFFFFLRFNNILFYINSIIKVNIPFLK